MQCVNVSDIAIITVKGAVYDCIIHEKFDAINLLENYLLEDCGYRLSNQF